MLVSATFRLRNSLSNSLSNLGYRTNLSVFYCGQPKCIDACSEAIPEFFLRSEPLVHIFNRIELKSPWRFALQLDHQKYILLLIAHLQPFFFMILTPARVETASF